MKHLFRKKKQDRTTRKEETRKKTEGKNIQEKRKTTKQNLNQRHNHSQDMIRITIQVFSNYSCTLLEKWSSILNTRFTSSNYIHLCLSIWCFQVLNGLLSKNRIVTPCTCINFEAAASLQQDLLESVDVQGRRSHDAASDQGIGKKDYERFIAPFIHQGLMVPKTIWYKYLPTESSQAWEANLKLLRYTLLVSSKFPAAKRALRPRTWGFWKFNQHELHVQKRL